MPESSIRFSVQGPDQDQVSKKIDDFFDARFGQRTKITKEGTTTGKEGAKEFIGAASLVIAISTLFLTIPGAVLASRDLADRMDKKKDVEDLIRLAEKLHKKYPDTDVTITTNQGSITLHTAAAGRLVDEYDQHSVKK